MTMNLSYLKHLLRSSTSPLAQLKKGVEILTARKCSGIRKGDDAETTDDKSTADKTETDDMQEPTTCCMSGCANCVWIQYAEKLSKSLADSDEDVQRIIMEKVQDPNMRAFLSLELRCRKLVR